MRFLLLLLALSSGLEAGLKAGAAARVITPDMRDNSPHRPIHLAGFGQGRAATGVHDDLYARCLALSTGAKATVVICGVDAIGLFNADVEKIRAAVKAKAGRPVEMIVAANHGHQGPDTMGLWGAKTGVSGIVEAYNQFVVDRTVEAALEALKGMKGARLFIAKDNSPVLKTFLNDTRPPVVNDAEVTVLRLTTKRRRALATLVNWANHPEALGSRNTEITADYLAEFYKTMETMGGGIPVFVNGAVGGMQSPLGVKLRDPRTADQAPANSFRFAEIIGQRLAEVAFEAVRSAPETKVNRIEYREKRVKIPVANANFKLAAAAGLFKGRKPFGADGTLETVVGYLRLSRGEKPVVEAAAIPGEAYPELSVGGVEKFPEADYPQAAVEPAVKQQMKAPYRMLFGLANDEIGYILPKAEWDEKAPYLKGAAKAWYGEVNSVGPEAGPVITGAFKELVR